MSNSLTICLYLLLTALVPWSTVACNDSGTQTSNTPNGDADSDSDSDTDADTDNDTDSDIDTDADTDTDVDTDTDADSDPDSDSDSDTDTDSDSDIDTDADTDPYLDLDTSSEPDDVGGIDLDVNCETTDWFSIEEDFSVFLDGLTEGVDYLTLADYVTPDGSTDNTQGFVEALADMNTTGIVNLFIPAGHYKINNITVGMKGARWFGSSIGISLIDSTGEGEDGEAEIGNGLNTSNAGHNISPHGLYFHNVKMESAGAEHCENGSARYINNVFMQTSMGRIIRDDYSCGTTISGNIFLGNNNWKQHTMKTMATSFKIRQNVFGLDMDNTDWLETEWSRADDWVCLTKKLAFLTSTLSLPKDMDLFHSLINAGGIRAAGRPLVFHGNIVNGNSVNGNDYTDHIVYFKGVQNAHIVANYFRGFYDDYTKFSGANDCIVAFNNYDGTEHRSYIEVPVDNGEGSKSNWLERIVLYGNYLGVDPYGPSNDENKGHSKLFLKNYQLQKNNIEEKDLYYSNNRQSLENAADDSPGIWLEPGMSVSLEHHIYSDNLLEDEAGPMILGGDASYLPASESFDMSLLGPWVGESVPWFELPPH